MLYHLCCDDSHRFGVHILRRVREWNGQFSAYRKTGKTVTSLCESKIRRCCILGLNAFLFGTQGLNYPIQSIPLYGAPFHLTILEYTFVAIIVFLFSGLAFSCLVLLVSALSRSSLISFFISAGIFVQPELVSKVMHQPWSETLLNFSYTGLLQVSRLFYQFLAYNVFGHPVLYPTLVFAIFAVISLIVTRLVYLAYGRHEVA